MKSKDAALTEPAQLGRKRDHSRDADILDATLEELALVGAAGLTMDGVAARAGAGKATIYRRWTSKTALIVDAIAHMKRRQADVEHLPDTGTLRGDLLALFKPQTVEESARRMKIMTAFASLLSQDDVLANAAHSAVVEPWAEAHHTLMLRARERGEIPPSADIGTLSQVVACMAAYRSLVLRKPFDLAFLVSMVDLVVLPALMNAPARRTKPSTLRRSPSRGTAGRKPAAKK